MAEAYPLAEPGVPELDHDNLSRLERMYPDNLIWRWTGEPELVMDNGDKLYASCIRPKEGDHDDGGPGTSTPTDKEGLVEVGECCAFKFTTHDPKPVGLITRLCEKADSQGLLCSKVVTYKPFMKLSHMPDTGVNYSKALLMETVGGLNLTENEVLLLCSHESQTFLQDIIFPVKVINVCLYHAYFIPTTVNPSTGGDQAAADQGRPDYCCLGLYDVLKNRVKLLLDEDFSLKDYLVPELTEEMLLADMLVAESEMEGNVMDEWVDDEDEAEENVEEENVEEENVEEENVEEENVGKNNVGEENVGEENVGEENVGEENVGEENVVKEDVGEEKLGEEKLEEEKLEEEKLEEENVGEENVVKENVVKENVGKENVGKENVME